MKEEMNHCKGERNKGSLEVLLKAMSRSFLSPGNKSKVWKRLLKSYQEHREEEFIIKCFYFITNSHVKMQTFPESPLRAETTKLIVSYRVFDTEQKKILKKKMQSPSNFFRQIQNWVIQYCLILLTLGMRCVQFACISVMLFIWCNHNLQFSILFKNKNLTKMLPLRNSIFKP